eukprot:CAMPEP_0206421934 /NCGR_PEP_ID=MMETSP0324_2-20121206/1751_1 /ASSEMBLY_ACC=CAM_ASM_000836 /TAXON_ID=2866 /ORGANISM="Crypthecodinium cohnii, Strain Seligo" /LENGTH=82 /DNA_ID=CAMNT_0053886139 /DNA_START=505 /DNA_END=750 /DNA_ORIENTATION=+
MDCGGGGDAGWPPQVKRCHLLLPHQWGAESRVSWTFQHQPSRNAGVLELSFQQRAWVSPLDRGSFSRNDSSAKDGWLLAVEQ